MAKKTLSYYKKKFGSENIWKLTKDKKGYMLAVSSKNRGRIQKDINEGKMKIVPNLKILVKIK